MTHEKIFKDSFGDSYKIRTSLFIEFLRNEFRWRHEQWVCPKGKRKFTSILRGGPEADSQILETKMELWNKLKPE